MRLIKLKNVSDKDIIDFPVEEALLDDNGELIAAGEGNVKKTGQTLAWTIKSGETLSFPFYVAEYLLKIYGKEDPNSDVAVLEKVGEEKSEEKQKKDGDDIDCIKCGKTFTSIKGYALHKAAAHPEDL